jgi:hypothetical protein
MLQQSTPPPGPRWYLGCMNAIISRAVAIFRESPSASDEEICRRIVSTGIESGIAARLVELLPMAYCRSILTDSGTRFSDRFQRKQADGSLAPERLLATEPLWEAALTFAIAEKQCGTSGKDRLAIAVHSAEFDAANQLLNRGAKPANLVLTTPVFQWPESGPTL